MAELIIPIAFLWLLNQLIKDFKLTQIPEGTDFRQVNIDMAHGVSDKEIDIRIHSGYYVKEGK